MRLRDISFNNLIRRRGRAIFVALGLLLGVATVVTLVSVTEAVQADVQDKLDRYGANIVITPKTNDLALAYGGVSVASAAYDVKELTTQDVAAIRTIEAKANLANVAPKLAGTVKIGDMRGLLVGVDFDSELRMKSWWQIDGQVPQASGELLLGAKAAAKLNASSGQEISLGGDRHRVTGVIRETGSAEDSVLFADLATAERVLGRPGTISFVEVSALCNACPIEEIVSQLKTKLPDADVMALSQAVEGRRRMVDQLTAMAGAISIVVVLIGGLVVLSTTMGAVTERTREVGILRAVGFRRWHIARIFLLEAAIVGALGGFAGWLVGLLAGWALTPALAGVAQGVPIDPVVGLGAVAAATVVALVGSAYPALRAASLDPVEALRFI
ncbi:MAG: ABC transporter permease [Chloroflexota bacterium]